MSKKISPTQIKEAIVAKAKSIKRKKEIYSELKKLNEELSTLNELGIIGGFGFDVPGDASKRTTTGFVNSQDLSYVKQLMADTEKEENLTKSDSESSASLKEENEKLKKELEELKAKSTIS